MHRLKDDGTDGFSNQELVELLLLYSVRQKDTDEVTKRLFDYFGSMSEVLEAPLIELCNTEGVSKNSAVLLSMIPQIARRVQMDHDLRKKINGMDAIREFTAKCFIGKTVEHFLLICLDKNMNIIRYDFISKGSMNSSTVDIRRIVHLLINVHAVYAVVAHNHPRGYGRPSREDIQTTQVIVNALTAIGVKLLDHFIVSSRNIFSFADAPSDIRSCMIPD